MTSARDRRINEDRGSLLGALDAAAGYLLNTKIDLETGCPKATAIKTIEGGLAMVRAAIAKAKERAI